MVYPWLILVEQISIGILFVEQDFTLHIACQRHLQTRKARDVGVAYNGQSQRPGQLWAARAGLAGEKNASQHGPGPAGRQKERLGPGAGQAKRTQPWWTIYAQKDGQYNMFSSDKSGINWFRPDLTPN